jgi:hypothetical protein
MAYTFDDYKDVPCTGSSNGMPIALGDTYTTVHTKGISTIHKLWVYASNDTVADTRVTLRINGIDWDELTIGTYSRKNILGPDHTLFGNEGATIEAYISNGASGACKVYCNVKEQQEIQSQ